MRCNLKTIIAAASLLGLSTSAMAAPGDSSFYLKVATCVSAETQADPGETHDIFLGLKEFSSQGLVTTHGPRVTTAFATQVEETAAGYRVKARIDGNLLSFDLPSLPATGDQELTWRIERPGGERDAVTVKCVF